MTTPTPDQEARRAGILRARAALEVRDRLGWTPPFRIALSGPPRLVDERTQVLMGVRAQALADARRHARIAPALFLPAVQP